MAKSDTLGGTVTTKVFYEGDLDEVEAVKLSATTLYSVGLTNASGAVTPYLKFYDTTSAVTLGTTAPSFTFGVQPNYLNSSVSLGTAGLAFANGMQIAIVTEGGGTAGSTAPTAAVSVTLVFS